MLVNLPGLLAMGQRTAAVTSLSIACPICSFKASNPFELRTHAIMNHLRPNEASDDVRSKSEALLLPNTNPMMQFECELYQCALCGVASSELNHIKDHVNSSHPDIALNHHTNQQCAILSQKMQLCSGSDDASSHLDDSEDEHMGLEPTLLTPDVSSGHPCISELLDVSAIDILSTTPNQCAQGMYSKFSRTRGHNRDWSKLIARSEKKFVCLLCRRYIYSGRTEAVFHSVTRHLMHQEIEYNLSHYGRLTDVIKRQIGQNFAEGMRIRSGVHYKDAKRVEAALFKSIELHLRYRSGVTTAGTNTQDEGPREHSCSGCGAVFNELQDAFAHVNDELRSSLPEFMRARSCPWSLSTRDEWVWCVPDLLLEPLPAKLARLLNAAASASSSSSSTSDMNHRSIHHSASTPQIDEKPPSFSPSTGWSIRPSSSSSVGGENTSATAMEVVKSLVAAASFLQSTGSQPVSVNKTDPSYNE